MGIENYVFKLYYIISWNNWNTKYYVFINVNVLNTVKVLHWQIIYSFVVLMIKFFQIMDLEEFIGVESSGITYEIGNTFPPKPPLPPSRHSRLPY